MAALHASERMETEHITITDYVTLTPGNPIRLFPFGRVVKNGKEHLITPETAAQFKLPHFDPPVKLGSHKDETPSGAYIKRLEVRNDGLYAHIELTDKGAQALAQGDYRYHSPEVVWEGGFEDPTTGEITEGPFIVGDALLHTPHLGQSAALFTSEVQTTKEKDMTNTVEVPTSLWDKFMVWIDKAADPPKEPPAEPEVPEEYKAAVVERDQYKAEIEAMKAEREKASRVDAFAAQLSETKVAGEGMAELLAGLDQAHAEKIMEQFKALSAQINESALTGEAGSDAGNENDNPKDAFKAAVDAKAEEMKISWVDAYEIVKKENPELLQNLR